MVSIGQEIGSYFKFWFDMQTVGALPMDLLGEVVQRCAHADMRNLLLTCKAWSRVVPLSQPRCSLMLVKHTDVVQLPEWRQDRDVQCCRHYAAPPRSFKYQSSYAHVRDSLATPLMRDVVICGSGLEATAFREWSGVSCLQLSCMHGAASLGSLRGATLRAFRLGYVRFDAAGEATLCAALASMVALEWLAIQECQFPGRAPGRALYDALAQCGALRQLEFDGVHEALLCYAGLQQITHFRFVFLEDYEAHEMPDPPPHTALKHLTVEIEETFDTAWIAKFLTRNSTIEDLKFCFPVWSDQLEQAIMSMTGVKCYTTSTSPGMGVVHRAAWKTQLTHACFYKLFEEDTAVLPVLATHATQLTSLVLDLRGLHRWVTSEEDLRKTFADIMAIGRCTALRSLRLGDDLCRGSVSDFIPPLCKQVLQPLTRLTQLVIAPYKDWKKKHKASVRKAAACDVEFVDCLTYLQAGTWGRVPTEYRV